MVVSLICKALVSAYASGAREYLLQLLLKIAVACLSQGMEPWLIGWCHLLAVGACSSSFPWTCPDVKVKGTFWVLEPWIPNPHLAFRTCRYLLLHQLCCLLADLQGHLPPSSFPLPVKAPHRLPPCRYSQPVASWSPFVCFIPGN